MAHQIVWCDIPVTDLDRAIRFYSAVLDPPSRLLVSRCLPRVWVHRFIEDAKAERR